MNFKKKTISILAIVLILTATISTANAASFTDLSNLIDGTAKNGILELNSDFIFNSFDIGIKESGKTITKSITINGNGHTIDLNNIGRLMEIKTNNVHVILNNLTIINGKSTGTGGGAIWLSKGSLDLNNITIANTTANNFGGAIHVRENTVLTIVDSLIENNTGKTGGAIYIKDTSVLNLINSQLLNNNANSLGGAIHQEGKSTINILNSEISNNTASTGAGAIHNLNGNLTINNGTFQNNEADFYGGAIRGYGIININNSLFNNNLVSGIGKTESRGGAINIADANVSISNTQFLNNQAENGGAIRTNGTLLLNNIEFQNNIGNAANILANDNGLVLIDSLLPGNNANISLNNNNYTTINQASIIKYFKLVPETPKDPENPENPETPDTEPDPKTPTPVDPSSIETNPDTPETGNSSSQDSEVPSTHETSVTGNESETLNTTEEPSIPAGVEDPDEENGTNFVGDYESSDLSTSGNIPMQNTGIPIILLILSILTIIGVSIKK